MFKAAGLVLALTMPIFAQAQGDGGLLDGPRTRLSVRSVAFYTDNFYYSPAGETSALGGLVSPELRFISQTSKLNFSTLLNAEYGTFDLPGSEDNYLDGGIDAKLGVQTTARNQVRVGGGFRTGHDSFGIERTEDPGVRDIELDKWNLTKGSLHYHYGAPGAKMNAEVGISAFEKDYTTNEPATSFLDHNATTLDYGLFYNYSPKTSALVDFSRTDYDFDQPLCATPPCGADSRGGQLYRARVGMRWLATGKTSGDVRVGYRRRIFDSSQSDIESADWEVGIDWAPVPRTTVRLESAYSEQQSYTNIARVIDVESASILWKYNLTARTRSTVRLDHARADFEGSARADESTNAGVSMEHLAMSYLWIVGSIGMSARDSSFAVREYDRLNAFVGVRLGR